ncbi:MAG TPA: alkaline phosphatase family protein [Mycobacteriales bacterium]|nr:alkaline phosphatase family protein [Mycobacteriales bacterium]
MTPSSGARSTTEISRRGFLTAGAGAAAATLLPAGIARAATPGRLEDIEHVVILMNENRSFDHYFGTYPGVRGFSDPDALSGVFDQAFPARGSTPARTVRSFHLDTASSAALCTPDPTHGYGPQHQAWHDGAMDQWGAAHAGDDDDTCMGYYTRADLDYFYAVADEFTICDAYHCSVMGSTTSNRLYAMTGMLDPDGKYGGPVLGTQMFAPGGQYDEGWVTFPEVLTAAGVSWKSYSEMDGNYEDNPLYLFKQYWPENYSPGSDRFTKATQLQANMAAAFPADFIADCAAGTLPSVSWITEGIVQSEHPSASPHDGENMLSVVIDALVGSPLWPKVALFSTYDENGGYFDHVPPPTAPAGTSGEWAGGLPIGLGYRVPMLIVSPFSRAQAGQGFVARDLFDHTSILQFIERRWGVQCPNITDWRRETVGDLTSAFNFAGPDTSLATDAITVSPPTNFAQHQECVTEEATSSPYPTPTDIPMPQQEAGTRPSPSGLTPAADLPELRLPSLGAAVAAAAIGSVGWLRHRRRTVALRDLGDPAG